MVKILKAGGTPDQPVALRCPACDCLYELEGEDLFASNPDSPLSTKGPVGPTQIMLVACPMEECDHVMEFPMAQWKALRETGGMQDVREEMAAAKADKPTEPADAPAGPRPLVVRASAEVERVLRENEWKGGMDGDLSEVNARLMKNVRAMEETWEKGLYEPKDQPVLAGKVLDVMTLATFLYGRLMDLPSVHKGATMTKDEAEAKRAQPKTTIIGEIGPMS